jgi:hypothetical protein
MTINMVVSSSFTPIPDDQFIEVPVSAHLVRAVLAGDLEEMESAGDFHVTKPDEAETPDGPPPEQESDDSTDAITR